MIRTFASIIPDGFSQGERLRRLAIVLSARSCVTKLWGQLKEPVGMVPQKRPEFVALRAQFRLLAIASFIIHYLD